MNNPKWASLAIQSKMKEKKPPKAIKRTKRISADPEKERKLIIKEIDGLVQRAVCFRDTEPDGGTRMGRCVSCRRMLSFHKLQGGHFQSRKHWATRWVWECVNAQCETCNGPSGPPNYGLAGNYVEYRKTMVKRHGTRQVEKWESMKNAEREPSLPRAREIRDEVLAMIKEKGWHA